MFFGFISNLPTHLIESFKATLDDLGSADLLLHVVDILPADGSNPINNYLAIESELKKFDQAINFYKSCIETYPDYIEPHINLGMCLLLTGNYTEGWNEYEWRLKLPAQVYEMKMTKPKWTCLLYTSPSPRDGLLSRMPSSA